MASVRARIAQAAIQQRSGKFLQLCGAVDQRQVLTPNRIKNIRKSKDEAKGLSIDYLANTRASLSSVCLSRCPWYQLYNRLIIDASPNPLSFCPAPAPRTKQLKRRTKVNIDPNRLVILRSVSDSRFERIRLPVIAADRPEPRSMSR